VVLDGSVFEARSKVMGKLVEALRGAGREGEEECGSGSSASL